MGQISDVNNPWRQRLLSAPASFRGVVFHVETGALSGGRRVVAHEYPKRNSPYSEDMGRHAWRWQITGYLIYRPASSGAAPVIAAPPLVGADLRYDYVGQREMLVAALDRDGPGQLIHPVFAMGGIMVMCERYSMTESREKGGYTAFDMSFIDAGKQSVLGTDTAQMVNSAASSASTTASVTFNQGAFAGQGFGGGSTA